MVGAVGEGHILERRGTSLPVKCMPGRKKGWVPIVGPSVPGSSCGGGPLSSQD